MCDNKKKRDCELATLTNFTLKKETANAVPPKKPDRTKNTIIEPNKSKKEDD